MDESYKLDERQHERIYKRIERAAFAGTSKTDNPRVVITGGQPGSGKSKLLEQSRESFPDRNVVVINGDDLRNYHLKRREILRADDKRFAERTDPDSRKWTKRPSVRILVKNPMGS